MGYITPQDVERIAQTMRNTGYGQYLPAHPRAGGMTA